MSIQPNCLNFHFADFANEHLIERNQPQNTHENAKNDKLTHLMNSFVVKPILCTTSLVICVAESVCSLALATLSGLAYFTTGCSVEALRILSVQSTAYTMQSISCLTYTFKRCLNQFEYVEVEDKNAFRNHLFELCNRGSLETLSILFSKEDNNHSSDDSDFEAPSSSQTSNYRVSKGSTVDFDTEYFQAS